MLLLYVLRMRTKLSGCIRALRKIKAAWIALILFLSVIILSRCMQQPEENDAIRGKGFAGSGQCRTCHQSVFDAYVQTAHYHTSSSADARSIKGSFAPGIDSFVYSTHLWVLMQQKGNQFYQTLFENGRQLVTHPIDIVVGSGRKAQTYLYYDSARLFELPVSYFVPEHTWANSPGFPPDTARFDRFIPSGCFGCHSSGIAIKSQYEGFRLVETYKKGQIIYGIDCERCHGPLAEHVAYHQANPSVTAPKFVNRISTLNREQQIDMCSLCHSGSQQMQRQAFYYRPGDSLSSFFMPQSRSILTTQLDVHGNQDQLMRASRCYLESKTLTCITCHNTHVKERDQLAVFSQRCNTCHANVQHSFIKEDRNLAGYTSSNCIDCHMPLKPSSVITMLTRHETSAHPDLIRTHWIKIYPEETAKILAALRKGG